jgi:hypothetical protein
MDSESLEQFVSMLQVLREHAQDIRITTMSDGPSAYFKGFAFALRAATGEWDMKKEAEMRRAAADGCGWDPDGGPLHEQMASRGLSPDEIVSELATVEIEFIRAVLNQPS